MPAWPDHERLVRACGLFLAAAAPTLLMPCSAVATRPLPRHLASVLYLQDAQAGAPSRSFTVPPQTMAARCVTMVSPRYPESAANKQESLIVTVRAIIRKSGSVTPVRAISGATALQLEAMNAVRAWRYRPFEQDGEPVDVMTDIRVNFEPGKPGGLITHPNR